MHEIFISYSSKHRDLTRELATVLEQQYGKGSVWWDQALEARGPYNEQIEAALNNARVAVVIWTTDAAVSRWVCAEAARASEHGKLVNVRPSDVRGTDMPMPFNTEQFAALEAQDQIFLAIAAVWKGTPRPTKIPLYLLYEHHHGRPILEPKRKPLPANALPSELLQAKYGVVPYADVSGMAADLEDWCTSLPHPTAGRLIHGPGGLGKTRLLIHVAARLREQGWMAGFLDRPDDLDEPTCRQRWQALEQLVDHGTDAGLLLVIDYAEARRDELVRLARRLQERPNPNSRPIRLVLLARTDGEWWDRLVEREPDFDRIVQAFNGQPAIRVLPKFAEGEQRLALFNASRDAFRPLLAARGYRLPAGEPSPDRRRRLASGKDYGHRLPCRWPRYYGWRLMRQVRARPESTSCLTVCSTSSERIGASFSMG